MAKVFETENIQKEIPIFLFYGKSALVNGILLPNFLENGKIISVTERKETSTGQEKGLYKIPLSSCGYVNKIEEKIDYAIIIIETEEDKKNFFEFLPKLQIDQTKTLLILPARKLVDFQDIAAGFVNKKTFDIALLGDIFSNNLAKDVSPLNSLLTDLTRTKSLSTRGDDLTAIFPISENDLATGIKQILFGRPKKNKIFSLFYNHPQTLISLIHILKHVENDLEIKFEGETGEEITKTTHSELEENLLQHGLKLEYLDDFFTGFEKEIKNLHDKSKEYLSIKTAPAPDSKQIASDYFMDKKASVKKQSFAKLFFFCLSFATAFILTINLFLLAGLYYYAKMEIKSFTTGNYLEFMSTVPKIIFITNFLEPEMTMAGGLFPFQNYFYSIKNLNNLALLAIKNVKNLESGGASVSSQNIFNIISTSYLIYFEAEKENPNNNLFKNLNIDMSLYSKLLSLNEVMKNIFALNNSEKYLVLFENNGELRPTGGFIGSVGELSVDKGSIKNFDIKDVYDLDGQLKAHLEPYYIVRRFLQPHLYLRDSNFDPDFEKSASLSALLYNLESGKTVDGVISIDYSVLKSILHEIGPITLRDYDKTLDENNAFEFIQNSIESNFFPGSKQKKEILNAILREITLNLEKNKNNLYKIILLLPKLIQEKHILFAFPKNSIQSAFSSNGFSDNYHDGRKKDNNVLYDLIGVNEANIGVNKANAYIKRSVKYDVFLDNAITSRLTLDFDNEGEKNLDYKTYIRVVVPSGSLLSKIKINDQEQPLTQAITDPKIYEDKNFKQPAGLEVDTNPVGENGAFGFIVNIAKGKNIKIELSYKNNSGTFATNTSYDLLYFKQPGTDSYPFSLNINYPQNLTPASAPSQNGIVSISNTVSKDEVLNVDFTRK